MAPIRLGVILRELNAAKQRATYGAVGGLLGRLPRSVMQGLAKNAAHSWGVLSGTEEPSGYHPAQLGPALHRNPHVIREAAELKQWFDGTYHLTTVGGRWPCEGSECLE